MPCVTCRFRVIISSIRNNKTTFFMPFIPINLPDWDTCIVVMGKIPAVNEGCCTIANFFILHTYTKFFRIRHVFNVGNLSERKPPTLIFYKV